MTKDILADSESKTNQPPADLKSTFPSEHAVYLESRGVLNAAHVMGWTARNYYDSKVGFSIPVQDAGGQRARFRAIEPLSDGSKTRWFGARGSYTPQYYCSPYIEQHITANGGRLIIASGEFDLLTFHTVNWLNVIAFTSEGAVPDDLAETLTGWGVTHVDYWLDNDNAGLKSGRKVADRLDSAGITFRPLSLAGLVDAKGDTNDLWQLLKFDQAAFIAALESAPLADLPQPEIKPAKADYMALQYDSDYEQALEQLKRRLGDLLGVKGYKADGWSRRPVSSPFRDDRNPSASYNLQSGVLTDFGTGENHSPKTLAEFFGLEYPRRRAALRSQATKTPQEGIRSPNDSDSRFEPRLAGDVTGHVRYMNQLPIPVKDDLLLIGDTGTGKTKLLSDLAAGSSVLAITHRVTLSAALSEALDTENYKGLIAAQLRQVSRLNICVDSLWKLVKADGTVPAYDVLILDEIEQLLSHVATGSTVRDKREQVYSVLVELLRKAGRVISADAYAGVISRDWLGSIRGNNPTVVTNTQARKRGNLTTYAAKTGLLSRLIETVDQDAGVIVLATSSRNLAKVISRHTANRYGEGSVLAIHQHSTDDPAVKGFLKHPDKQIGQYRLVIYSPTVGSGVDIQTPVRAVFGVFLAEPLDAFDCHQMLNRCRNAGEVHLYVESREIRRETNPATIYQDALENARQTARIAQFDAAGVLATNDIQTAVLDLHARLTAQRNDSKNQVVNHVMRLAKGYTSYAHDLLENPAILDELTAQRNEINELDKSKTLVAIPVNRHQFEALLENGELTLENRYGHQRWKIEQAAGQQITPEIYDLLHTDQQRAALYLLADALHTDIEQLKERDRHNTRHGLQDRRHYTRKALLFQAVIRGVFGEKGLNSTEEITGDDLAFRVDTILLTAGEELRRLFGRRSDKSESPIAVLRWLLNRFGLKLVSRQRGKGDNRIRVYWLDQDSSSTMQALAASCWQRQFQDAQADVMGEGTQNRESTNTRIPILSFSSPVVAEINSIVAYPPFYPDRPGWDAVFRPLRR